MFCFCDILTFVNFLCLDLSTGVSPLTMPVVMAASFGIWPLFEV